MFNGAAQFNQPLSNWNVSKVIIMASILGGTEVFNQPLNSWDVSSVTDLNFMFKSAARFNPTNL
jgi:surface protein